MSKVINVSSAFENCAFHAISAHLLAHQERTSDKKIIDRVFNSELRQGGVAELIDGQADFDVIFEEIKKQKAEKFGEQSTDGGTFEQVLVLGLALRAYLKRLLLSDSNAQKKALNQFKTLVNSLKETVRETALPINELLELGKSDSDGAMIEATTDFLLSLNWQEDISEQQLERYWQQRGQRAYADYLGQEKHRVSFKDLEPLCEALAIPLEVCRYDMRKSDKHGSVVSSHQLLVEDSYPKLTLLINESEGHYYVTFPDDNEFADRLRQDTEFYDNARKSMLEWSVQPTQRQGIADKQKPFFLAVILPESEQIDSGPELLINKLKGLLQQRLGRTIAPSKIVLTPPEKNKIVPWQYKQILDSDDEPLVMEYLETVRDYLLDFGHAAEYSGGLRGLFENSFKSKRLDKQNFALNINTLRSISNKIRQKLIEQYSPNIDAVFELEDSLKDDVDYSRDRFDMLCMAYVFISAVGVEEQQEIAQALAAIARDMKNDEDEFKQDKETYLLALSRSRMSMALHRFLARFEYGSLLERLQWQLARHVLSNTMVTAGSLCHQRLRVCQSMDLDRSVEVLLYKDAYAELQQRFVQLPAYKQLPYLSMLLRQLEILPIAERLDLGCALYAFLSTQNYQDFVNGQKNLLILAQGLQGHAEKELKLAGLLFTALLTTLGILTIILSQAVSLGIIIAAVGCLIGGVVYFFSLDDGVSKCMRELIHSIDMEFPELSILEAITKGADWDALESDGKFQKVFVDQADLEMFMETYQLDKLINQQSKIKLQVEPIEGTSQLSIVLTGADKKALTHLYSLKEAKVSTQQQPSIEDMLNEMEQEFEVQQETVSSHNFI